MRTLGGNAMPPVKKIRIPSSTEMSKLYTEAYLPKR